MLPRVSVVIPTYKSAAWVEATLDSVMRQTFPADRLEIIVIDDASPDDSVAVARRVLGQHERNSRIIEREKNCGVPVTRNAGWRAATGDWIQFLDADDLLAPHKIELQADCAARAEADVAVVYSNWQHLLLTDGKWQPSGPLNEPFVDDDPLLQILEQVSFGYVGPTLIRRSFLEQIGGFGEQPNLGEDCDMMMRIAMAGGRFRQARSTQAAFLYRQSPNSLWRSYIKNKQAMRNLLGSFHKAEQFLRERRAGSPLSERERRALAMRYSRFADFYVEHDPDSFRLIKGWLKELGFKLPTELTPNLRILSSVLGYENAVRLRATYRKLRSVGTPQ